MSAFSADKDFPFSAYRDMRAGLILGKLSPLLGCCMLGGGLLRGSLAQAAIYMSRCGGAVLVD